MSGLAAADLLSLAGWALVLAAGVTLLLARPWLGPWVALALVGSALWPTQGLTWAMHLRGVVGDPCVPMVWVAFLAVAAPAFKRPVSGADRMALAAGSAVAGVMLVALHLTSVQTGSLDLYRWGYRGWGLPTAVALLALVAAVKGWWRTASAWAWTLAAWGLGLPESTNLWDALVDPWWTLLCILLVSTRLIGRRTQTP